MSNNTFSTHPQPSAPRLLDQVRDRLRVKHSSLRTEQAYLAWIKQYILFHDKRHPVDMFTAELEAFLTYLAHGRNVASVTQAQFCSAGH